jgi:hypothetical protein
MERRHHSAQSPAGLHIGEAMLPECKAGLVDQGMVGDSSPRPASPTGLIAAEHRTLTYDEVCMAKGKQCPTKGCGMIMFAVVEKEEKKGTWVTYECPKCHMREKVFEDAAK